MRALRAWFLPRDHDVLALLRAQADTVGRALGHLGEWAGDSVADGATVAVLRGLLREENTRRHDVLVGVRDSFSTPLEAEDLFELAEQLGDVAEVCYAVVREADLTGVAPEPHLRAVIATAVRAMGPIGQALQALPRGHAAKAAEAALAELVLAEHAYRDAIAALEAETDLKRELRLRELYRRAEHLTLAQVALARRIWYAVYKRQ